MRGEPLAARARPHLGPDPPDILPDQTIAAHAVRLADRAFDHQGHRQPRRIHARLRELPRPPSTRTERQRSIKALTPKGIADCDPSKLRSS